MDIIFFPGSGEFRKWLEQNHLHEKELLVGYYKKATGKPSMTWPESVDQALCFGWIDGVRRSLDDERYYIRFTPRNPKSNWSEVNVKKAEELIRKGLMQPAGLALYQSKDRDRVGRYSYENRPEKLPAEMERKFMQNTPAWEFFTQQAPSYQKAVIHWVLDARRKETQESRLDRLINRSEQKKRMT